MDALVAVRRRIAQAIVGAAPAEGPCSDDACLGDVTLRSHQVDALRRLRTALESHGGALLADAPGLGKTYVALALARDSGGAVVIAPSALRAQWMRAAAHAAVRVEWWSLEQLSRRPVVSRASLLIVDEAHHLRNPGTRRYASVAALAIGKRVLLLSATPVHNRAADRDALLALFAGASAATLPDHVLAQIIVRREANAALLPHRRPVRWLAAPRGPDVSRALRALPPPLPAADGREAAALLRLTLAHAWSSSVAAFDATVRRALHHAAAIDDALAAGRWPTRRELSAWVTTAESSQLAFAALVAAPAEGDIAQARVMLARHVGALEALRSRLAGVRDDDTIARAALLRRVLTAHPGATVIAFSRYAGTIDALWTALRFDTGVVAITARGVRSAGGGVSRHEVLSALASQADRDARIPLRLVLSTDLLGEGLDLLAVSVIVHLDQPWTPARLDQREGRARRLGSTHATVTTYAVRPPRGAAQLLMLTARLHHKRAAMEASVAAGDERESLLAIVRPWLAAPKGGARLVAVRSGMDGWIAALRDTSGRDRVIVSIDGAVTEDDRGVRALCALADRGHATAISARRVANARRRIRQWVQASVSAQLIRTYERDGGGRSAIARRLDDAVHAAPLNQRAAIHSRVVAAKARIATLRGAGSERALAAAARCASIAELLHAVERLGSAPDDKRPAARGSRLLALLLFVADARNGATDRPPTPCSPHATACSGTAAPR